jgi:hypothetical protein
LAGWDNREVGGIAVMGDGIAGIPFDKKWD